MNITKLTGESIKHLHGLTHDPETNRLYAIGRKPSRYIAWSDNYGLTRKTLKFGEGYQGIVYNDYFIIGINSSDGIFYFFLDKNNMTTLKRIIANQTYYGPGIHFALDIVEINTVLYNISYGYNKTLRTFNYNGVTDIMGIRDPSINQGWSKIANDDINGKIVVLHTTNGVSKLIVFNALIQEEADYVIGKKHYLAGYQGPEQVSIDEYVKELNIMLEPYSIIDTLLFYEDFEDGDISG